MAPPAYEPPPRRRARACGLAFDSSPDVFAVQETARDILGDCWSSDDRPNRESEGAAFLEDAAELWRRREANGSIRIQEGEPPSFGAIQSFLIRPVTPATRIALSSHPAITCAQR